jgi:predicted dehydrogenase
VIGLGQRGTLYARALVEGGVLRGSLAAVCDPDAAALAEFRGVSAFATFGELLGARVVDALIVATPPTEHAEVALAALDAGLHVLCEKPLAPRKLDAERIVRRRERLGPGAPLLATALPLRADPRYVRVRTLLRDGVLGELSRVSWTVTDCFRSAAYYAERPWRARFSGEGGGLLLNQCLHQLDLWQWLFGMPSSVRAVCGFGRHHDVEVEDEVSAQLEHPRGLSGVFLASSGEAAGTNRLELVGDRARAVLEGEELVLTRYAVSSSEAVRTGGVRARGPLFTQDRELILPSRVGPRELLENFVNAVLDHTPLVAPGSEALAAVELANALLFSGLVARSVALPLDGTAFADALNRRPIAEETLARAEPLG